jgi:hypothetical protein
LGGIKSIIKIPTMEVMKTPRIAPRRSLSLRMPSQTHIATLISQRKPSPRYVIAIVLAFLTRVLGGCRAAMPGAAAVPYPGPAPGRVV